MIRKDEIVRAGSVYSSFPVLLALSLLRSRSGRLINKLHKMPNDILMLLPFSFEFPRGHRISHFENDKISLALQLK